MITIIALAALAKARLFTTESASWSVTVSGITGLYNSSGTQTTSSVNLTKVSYVVENDAYESSMSPATYTIQPIPPSNYWVTTIKLKFSNSGWQTAPSGTVVGVQVANCQGTHSNAGYALSVQSDFSLLGSSALSVNSSTGALTASLNYSTVNPELFSLSSFSIDTSDSSGDTAIISWNSTPTSPTPWNTIPGGTECSATLETFFPALWAFPVPGSNGFFEMQPIANYPVPPSGPLARR